MDIEASHNFRRISERLTTSGSVPPDGLKALREQGYEVVVDLLPGSSEYAIPDERQTVESQGIEYVNIPVDFKRPTSSDFWRFAQALDRVNGKKVHVHCAANYRVSAFYSLYMVGSGLWSSERAMEFIHSIWQPTEHPCWSDFIVGILAEIGARQSVPVDRRDAVSR